MDNSDIIENQPNEVNSEFKNKKTNDSQREQEEDTQDQQVEQQQQDNQNNDIQQQEEHEQSEEDRDHYSEQNYQSQQNNDLPRKESQQHENLESKFLTPQQEFPSTQEMYSTQTKESKKTSAKKKKKALKKNFVEDNLKVKTMSEIKKEKTNHKRRQSETSHHQRLSSLLQLRQSLAEKGYKGRQENWEKMLLNYSLLSNPKYIFNFTIFRPCQSGQKNQSKEFVVKHIEISLQDIQNHSTRNNLGGTFSKSKKEKAYHLTNSSSITMLNSYKCLDLLEKPEYKTIPKSKGNQALKRSVNQSQVFPNKMSFVQPMDYPEGFDSHKGAKPIVHNMTNPTVQSQRWRNRQSSLF